MVQTAPSARQVEKIMWGDTLVHWNNRKHDLGGTAFRTPYLEFRKEDWYLTGFTTKETGASADAQGGKFQGFHSPNVLVIVSEAQAVEDTIYDQIDGITTSENTLVIFIGNPTRAGGRFAKGLRDKTNNIVFNFSCLENPNYLERRTVIPGLCSYKWVEDKRRKWGEDDPRWYGRVLGQIPKTSINSVFSEKIVEQMKKRKITEAEVNAGVALDVAGEGTDDNVITTGNCGNVKKIICRLNQSPGQNAIECLNEAREINGSFIIIDCDGMGVRDYQEIMRLDEAGKYVVVKFHGSATEREEGDVGTKERAEFANMRAKAWITVARAAAKGLCSMPADPELEEDLLEPQYFVNKKGLLQIEDKDDIKDRLGRSPNKGDSWVLYQYAQLQRYRKPEPEDEAFGDRQGHGEPMFPVEHDPLASPSGY